MATRNDRDVDTSREDRGGWMQQHGNFGRIQSRDDMRDVRARDWRHDDRFGRRDEEVRADRDDDDDDRGWFDRVRDTASRWFHGRDDDDDRDDERNRNEDRYRDDDRNRFRAGGDEGSYRSRDDMDRWERRTFDRDHQRSWQDDDHRGRMREGRDNRSRQFVGHDPDNDDRSGQFNRLRDERGTLGRRGDVGLSGRTPYDRFDERGRFSGFAGDADRYRMYGDDNRNRPLGDERGRFSRALDFDRTHDFDRDLQSRGFPRQTSGIGREWQSDDRDRQLERDDRNRQLGRSDRGRQFGSGDRDRQYGGPYDRGSQYGGPYDRGSQYGGHDDSRGYGRSSVRSYVGEDHRMTHDEHRQGRDDNRQQYGSYGRDDNRQQARSYGRDDNRPYGRDDNRQHFGQGRDEYGRFDSRRRR